MLLGGSMRSRLNIHIILITTICLTLPCPATEIPNPNDPNRYLNAVLTYGRDTYGPKHTPLFVDGLNIHTHEPVKWIDPDGTKWILSNFASQQTLMRTLDGLTGITGDPKYKQAAMDAIRYVFENLRSPNGLLYWGSHAAYNATADKPRSRVHELKLNYPFYELMWQVDSKVTKQFIESFWSAHVLDWSNLDFNRHGQFSEAVEEPWEHEYDEGGPKIFEGRGRGFPSAATSLIQAGTTLYKLSGQEQSLVWSKRLAKRYVDTRDPSTGRNRTYNLPPELDKTSQLGISLQGEGFNENRDLYYSEIVKAHLWISSLLTGEMLETQGGEFKKWILEEMTVWSQIYRESNNSLDNTQTTHMALDLGFFWGYATAYHVTGDEFMWEIARDVALGHSLGDIGKKPQEQPQLRTDTNCSDVYGLLGFLELYAKTRKKEFLHIARCIGDNLLHNQFYKGFFVPSKDHIYTRFDSYEPLTLLYLHAAIESETAFVPRLWPSSPVFDYPYRYKQGSTDRVLIYALTESTEPPLSPQEAAAIGDIDMVRSLLKKGVGIDSWDDSYKKTALQCAALSGHREAVELLLDNGARIDAQDDFPGGTALDYAAENGHRDVVELLIAHGADLDVKRRWPVDDTPLHSAARAGRKYVVELLIEKGADVNAKNKNGDTPLGLAIGQDRKDIAELLRKHGAKE
jgi:pectate lyase